MYTKRLWGQRRLLYESLDGCETSLAIHYYVLCVASQCTDMAARYGIAVEQWKDGKREGCILAPFTNDVQAVRRFLTLLADGEILPVHVPEIWQDLYGDVPVMLEG